MWNDLGTVWNTVREVDAGGLLAEASQTPRLAIVGPSDKASTLQALLQRGPASGGQPVTAAPIYRMPLDAGQIQALREYDLRLVILERPELSAGIELQVLSGQRAPLVAIVDAPLGTTVGLDAGGQGMPAGATGWQVPPRIVCPLAEQKAVGEVLLPALVRALPGRELALARAFPALRPIVARQLIQEAATANATYAFTTGIGELAPILALPLTAADMVVLTKNQVLLAYKLALTMGEAGSARQVLAQLASVVGAGFIWRQLARELVGLIPAWGLVPKVAVAYAGTAASGQAVYHWYATGEKLREQELRATFEDALQRGRSLAAEFVARTRGQVQATRHRIRRPRLLRGRG